MEKSNQQIQYEKILELLQKSSDDLTRGGLVYFDHLTKDTLEQIMQIAPDFFEDSDRRWNDAPTLDEFMSFVELNKAFTFEGYVTNPEERGGETRLLVDGISAPASSDNVANLYMWINDERNLFIEPTELDDATGDIRAWWD